MRLQTRRMCDIPEYRLLRADLQSGAALAFIYTRSTHNPDPYPSRHLSDLYIVLVHFHTIPNLYLHNRTLPAAWPIASRLATLTSFSLPRLGSLTANIPKQLGIR